MLKVLKEDFPDVTISKIRFLEGEGLVSPERAPSGYRRYSDRDVTRLRYILDVQKNHYLPLKVIRENLDAMDAGEPVPSPGGDRPEAPPPEEALPPPLATQRPVHGKRPIHVTRRELLQVSGLSESTLTELEKHGLVAPRRGTAHYGRDALTVAVAARKLAAYGIDSRHLRAIKHAAEREAALIDQAVSAHGRRRGTSRQAFADVMQLVLYAHAALLRSSISN